MKKKVFSIVLWSSIFIAALVGVDRFLTTTELRLPLLSDVQHFYLDFRSRLAALAGLDADSIEEVIEPPPSNLDRAATAIRTGTKKAVDTTTAAARQAVGQVGGQEKAAKKELQYLYVDGDGQLNFTATLEEIPAEFRASAEELKD